MKEQAVVCMLPEEDEDEDVLLQMALNVSGYQLSCWPDRWIAALV